jgi:hypothetical protein
MDNAVEILFEIFSLHFLMLLEHGCDDDGYAVEIFLSIIRTAFSFYLQI